MPDLVILGLVLACASGALLTMPKELAERVGADGVGMAARYRSISLLAVVAAACLLRGLFPEPAVRDEASYLAVLTLGYGHLGGAAWFSLGRLRAPAGVSLPLLALFATTSVATLFGFWSWLANDGMAYLAPHLLWIFFALFAVSTWHVIENDAALARSYRIGLQLSGLGRRVGGHFVALAATAVVTGLGFRLFRSPSPWLSFGDFFTLVVLYHLVGWLVFFADRARRLEGQDRRRLLARLGLVHLPPAALAGLLLAWTPPGLAGLRELVFGPGVYSFFALLHVLQTAWIRVPESRGREVRHAG
jgi:hypothetical protein